MNNKKPENHNVPQKLKMGIVKRPPREAPAFGGSGGKIDTQFQDINWTPAKLAIASAILGIPFLIGIVIAFKSGSTLIGVIFLGIIIFVGLMYLALRYIEKTEF